MTEDIVDRLRRHAYRLISEQATMQMGYGVATERDDRNDMEAVMDEAADEIERLRARRPTSTEGGGP